ncbi:GIP [Symbiodinium necroappetens]|uniref:GIP protein n=1 Tax=Symbiodinium necroappetens TaxID=1628268 RepID=A0A812M882_9DINO|nr:GIP [Symbiodinium necroappetens]
MGSREKGRDEESVSANPHIRYGLVGAFRVPKSALEGAKSEEEIPKDESLTGANALPDDVDLEEYVPSDEEEADGIFQANSESRLEPEGAEVGELESGICAVEPGHESASEECLLWSGEKLPEDPKEQEEYLEGLSSPVDHVVLRYFVGLKSKSGADVTAAIQQMEEEELVSLPLADDLVEEAEADQGDQLRPEQLARKLMLEGDYSNEAFKALVSALREQENPSTDRRGTAKLDPQCHRILQSLDFRYVSLESADPSVCMVGIDDRPEPSEEEEDGSGNADDHDLDQDLQLDSYTPIIGWDFSGGNPGEVPLVHLEEVDLHQFLLERGIPWVYKRLKEMGVDEAIDLQFLYEEDLIEYGIPVEVARRVMERVHPPNTRRPDNPELCALRTGEVQILDREQRPIPWAIQNRTLFDDGQELPLADLGVGVQVPSVGQGGMSWIDLEEERLFGNIGFRGQASSSGDAAQLGFQGDAAQVGSQGKMKLRQSSVEANLWHLLDGSDTLLGYAIVYVDDIMVLASQDDAEAFYKWIRSVWQCTPLEGAERGKPITFLGVEVQEDEDEFGTLGFALSQCGYIEELIRSYGMSPVPRSVPYPKEWIKEFPPQEDYGPDVLRKAQRVTGEVLWVAQRSRPDIAFPVALMGSWCTRDIQLWMLLMLIVMQLPEVEAADDEDNAAEPLSLELSALALMMMMSALFIWESAKYCLQRKRVLLSLGDVGSVMFLPHLPNIHL